MVTDAFMRLAYKLAYQGARIYWRVAKPANRGALVAIWHAGKVLLVRNSYVNYYSLPGGNVRTGESALDAAVRELREEIDLEVVPERLKVAVDQTHIWEGRSDHVTVFRLDVEEAPTIKVDNREVISAEWFAPAEALELELFPVLRQAIEQVASD
jgi:ADP-ribose pyrophosphatase YjhB (NUDIX family)